MGDGASRPRSRARATASVRRWAPSLTNRWRMRVRTVVTDTDSSRAVSGADRFVARLEVIGVVLGQRQPPPPPPAASASAARIYPRSRSWSQGVGSPGIDAHQAWPGGGQEIIAIV